MEVTIKHQPAFSLAVVRLVPNEQIKVEPGAMVSHSDGLTTETEAQGGLVLLKVTGNGKVLACSYGAIEECTLASGQVYTVDTGHILGFDASVQFAVQKSGSWKSTILGGEGLVCRLTGPGRVLMQSRSEEAFLGWLLPKIPTKSN